MSPRALPLVAKLLEKTLLMIYILALIVAKNTPPLEASFYIKKESYIIVTEECSK